jgi:REP element-mobilizing transposase RayT
MRQIGFKFRTWGGKRRRAGAKPKAERAGVTHDKRPILKSRFPVHVTVRMRKDVCGLRNGLCFKALKRSFVAANERFGFRLVHFSVQGNHVHFLVEADDSRALSRGMQGLNIRMARALNRLMNRRGKVFADRYHAEILRSPTQTARALRYVLRNREHHLNVRWPSDWRDPYASAAAPIAPPRTWLLGRAPP